VLNIVYAIIGALFGTSSSIAYKAVLMKNSVMALDKNSDGLNNLSKSF
jgi:hypothetical protein